MRSRASEEKRTSLAGMLFNPWLEMKGRAASGRLFLLVGGCTLDHAHDVGLFHDQKVLTIDLDRAIPTRPIPKDYGDQGQQNLGRGREEVWLRTARAKLCRPCANLTDYDCDRRPHIWVVCDPFGPCTRCGR